MADDGTVTIAFRSTLVYVKRPGLDGEKVELPAVFDMATVSDSGNLAVLQTRTSAYPPEPVLWWFDLGSKQAIPIATAEEGCHSPSLNTDVTRMVFLSAANWLESNNTHRLQAFVMDLTTGVLKQLTKGTDTVAEAVSPATGGLLTCGAAMVRSCWLRSRAPEFGDRSPVAEPTYVSLPLVPGSRHSFGCRAIESQATVNGVAVKVFEGR